MALFQNSVLNKYLKGLEQSTIDTAFEKYTAYFHNSDIQENIRNSKEEQFQAKFLDELFVKILGYTLNPNPNFNLATEFKNVKGAKKADGAILKNNKAIAVIELKGTNTTDLDKIESQAFGYKNNQPTAVYVITSNFEKLRFYIDDAVDYLDFNLFTLTENQFKLLYLCLHKDHIFSNLPHKIKSDSTLQEENITKKLYKDYSTFKKALFNDLVKNNPDHSKLILFKKSQKLLDRFLFVFFAEDKGLLPPNSVSQIVGNYHQLMQLDFYQSLYDVFNRYFSYIDKGRPQKGDKPSIFAFNGGLFAPDEMLDNLTISDDILLKHTVVLSTYDFASEVDVNILGHIFEHSLNEIDEMTAEIEGQVVDKSKTKRKKDGVFYTPKYITKYIVENTVGKLCEEKKTELGIIEEDYAKDRRGRKKATLKKLNTQLEQYRKWLLALTICDPACGSGAFLNQALDFLIEEHHYIDELQTKLLGGGFVFPNVENSILENNLYGVDINEESVEIAKLSLWLRTVKKGRQLTSLNNNIKCGNSLIDDVEVAGDKAFKWEEEFPKVFENGGFDVVVGNPPYVDIKRLDKSLVKSLFETYKTTENRINLYSIFIEKGYNILKNEGFLSFINPNSILVNSSYTKIRNLLLNDVTTIIKLPDSVFKDASVETIIFECKKGSNYKDVQYKVFSKSEKIDYISSDSLKKQSKDFWRENQTKNFNIYVNEDDIKIIKKCEMETKCLGDLVDFSLGITPYDKYKNQTQELIKSKGYHSKEKKNEMWKPLIGGKNIIRYLIKNNVNEYLYYGKWLGRPREERFFEEERIIVRQIISGNPPRIYAGYTNESLYFTHVGFCIIPHKDLSVKYLLALLNSNLMNYYHKYKFLDLEKDLFQKILIANCKEFPIKTPTIRSKDNIVNKTSLIIENVKNLSNLVGFFIEFIVTKYDLPKISQKISSWYKIEAKEFLKELKKSKVKLDMREEADLLKYFKEEKIKAQEIETIIDKTDKEIDKMVYELYGLTDEEIEIVENS